MDQKPDGPKIGAMVGLGLGMVVCCVGLTLLTAGALSGVGAWLFDGGLSWLALASVLGAGGVFLWRRPKSGLRRENSERNRRLRPPLTAPAKPNEAKRDE